MSVDFKKKRIVYLNNWPNVEPFEIEKKYYSLVEKIKNEHGTIFIPYPLKYNIDVSYNKTISYMIEALDQLEKYPNFSYEFLFKAYDCFMNLFYSNIPQITDKNKKFCDNEWKDILNANIDLRRSFENLFSSIPVKACQYLYIRLSEKTAENKAYKRVTLDISGRETIESKKRKGLVDDIEKKYGIDYSRYSDTIRKASLLYRYILKNDSVLVNNNNYYISLEDKLHILVSGFLYTLRNDIMHGSSISITKSSKTTLGTFAIDYYAYLLLYYLLVTLIINKFPTDYSNNDYYTLAKNIEENINLYKQLFGSEIER